MLVLVLMLCRVVLCGFVLIHVCVALCYVAVICVLSVVLHCIDFDVLKYCCSIAF